MAGHRRVPRGRAEAVGGLRVRRPGSGRKIVRILGKNKADLTEADERHMRKVVGYVHRHSAQRPDGDVSDARWRRSLMNWGHDPLKQ
jgi:hypothetical protein